jgi:hypothetical protein
MKESHMDEILFSTAPRKFSFLCDTMTSENKIKLNRTVVCYRGRDFDRGLQE